VGQDHRRFAHEHVRAPYYRVNASSTLISLCRNRLPDQEWIVADMRSLALGRQFDGVLAWDSFFHLNPDDQRRMFDVFAAHTGTRPTWTALRDDGRTVDLMGLRLA